MLNLTLRTSCLKSKELRRLLWDCVCGADGEGGRGADPV
jgi:hypothetical protein